jgi:hypothetical protein
MSKLINNRRGHTSVYNDIINEPSMNLKAKGLYLYLYSKPDGWTFSARLIATQNRDSIDSIQSGLKELENFGLLIRTACQGGYDYEIFDIIKIHSRENPVSGKSRSTHGKIHSMEKPLNISNKEFKAKRKERDNNISFPPSPDFDIICGLPKDYPLIDSFLDFVSKSAKNPLAYRSSLRDSLFIVSHKKHKKTVAAYYDFKNSRPDLNVNGVLPVGVNIFDLIGRD